MLIEPNTVFEDRLTQVDVRLTKLLHIRRVRLQGMLDVYNLLNASTILARMEASLDDFDRARIEGMRLTLAQVRAHVERLWALPLAARSKINRPRPSGSNAGRSGAFPCWSRSRAG